MSIDYLSLVQTVALIIALGFSVYSIYKQHGLAKKRIKIEKVFESKIDSYVELYGIMINLEQILLQHDMLTENETRAIVSAITDFHKRLYKTLITTLYPYTLKGKHIFLSDDLGERVLKLVTPCYYRVGLLGFDLMKDIENEDQLQNIAREYEEKIPPETISKEVKEIQKEIKSDLELQKISEEFKALK